MHDIDLMLKLNLEGKSKEARAISDKLEKLGKDKILDPNGKNTEDIWMRHCFNRGWFILQDGDYQTACKLLENGRFLKVYGSGPLQTSAPIFNPEKDDIKGKSIIISLEGGYGDEIIHARFATSFKKLGASKVYLAAAPELVSIFSRIEGVDGVILRNQSNTIQHDFWVPGFSAGWVAGHTFDDFPGDPYITSKQESVDIWKTIIKAPEGKIKVGIRWAGNPKFEHQQFRRFPENFITNLSKYEELEIFSLQRDHNLLQLPEKVNDLQHFLLSWEDTAAAIQNLDIVITSCTSVAHLSAAMGKETWVIVPVLPYHTWAKGAPESTTTPYYNCVRLFRQKEGRNWNGAFQELYTALEEKFNLKHVDMPDEDREIKRINLGCGHKKFDNFHNVDVSPLVKPDEVVDLNVLPWPWKDNEYDHIVAKDILEHLGHTGEDFINVIKEMYRISANGAIWEIQFPHWRCDIALDDPTHKRSITVGTFNLFNKQLLLEKIKQGFSESLLAFEQNIDIEVVDSQFEYTDPWQKRIDEKTVSQDELVYAMNFLNNVILSVKVLIQIHKPGRIDNSELESALNKHE